MSSDGEGVGRLTIEDLQAMGESRRETATDMLRRLFAESETQFAAAEKRAEKATVLARAAVIATAVDLKNIGTTDGEMIAKWVFNVLDALDAEYERRYAGRS